MNILPKKRWHVRTKDNIARVRRDEAKAAEEELEKARRTKLAEQEVRTAFLRRRTRGQSGGGIQDDDKDESVKDDDKDKSVKDDDNILSKTNSRSVSADIYTSEGNINFFKDIEAGKQLTGSNKEHDEENKLEKEKYEKSIGLLTYLGQDSLEAKGGKAWFEDLGESFSRNIQQNEEIGLKSKLLLDPLKDMIKYARTKIYKKSGNEIDVEILSVSNNKSSLSVDTKRKKKKHKHKLKKSKKYMRSKKDEKRHRKKTKSKDDNYYKDNKRKRSESSSDSDIKKRKKRRKKSGKKSKKRKLSDASDDSMSNASNDSRSDTVDDSSDAEEKRKNLEKLRYKRLEREAIERKRAEKLLSGNDPDKKIPEVKKDVVNQKYNSQFNPMLAKQNKQNDRSLKPGVKYWMS